MSQQRRSMVVALTGGVAAGKTAVARRFEALGIHVYDADMAAREVVEPDTAGLAAIVEVFGTGMLDAAGRLDRRAMRQHVFSHPLAKQQLEAIIHPRVRQWLDERVQSDHGPYCLLAIPLLVENRSAYAWVDRVLLVDAPESLQVSRLMARDQIDENLARRMLAQQASRAERLAVADDVIENTGAASALDAAVTALHQRYTCLADAMG